MTSQNQTHEPTIVPAPKMDAPSLVAVQCSCGYRSAPDIEHTVRKSWQQHVNAKTEAAYDERAEEQGWS